MTMWLHRSVKNSLFVAYIFCSFSSLLFSIKAKHEAAKHLQTSCDEMYYFIAFISLKFSSLTLPHTSSSYILLSCQTGVFWYHQIFQFPAFWEVTGFYLKYLGNLMTSFNNEVAMLHYNYDDLFPFDDDNQGQLALMCTWALIMNNYTWSFRLWLAFLPLALCPGSQRTRRPPERAGRVSSSFL